METLETFFKLFTAMLMFGLAIAGLVGVVFYEAWWHVATVVVCGFFSAVFTTEWLECRKSERLSNHLNN